MSSESPRAIPDQPPPDALAELDAAARALDRLTRRSARLTLGMDEQTRAVRIELDEGDGATALTPTQLFTLLSSS
ncbi:MAG TPA: hypothetical protein VNP93_00185 [Gaiellaceae bacterium]|nr:hypothetical protein [Gaiellaceae bacterium]